MAKIDNYLDYEENFYSAGKRGSRKERRESQARDRSKFKKTDQDKKKVQAESEEPPLGANYLRGRVLSISPEMILVRAELRTYTCTLKGVLKKEKTKQKNLLAVGDWVHFEVKESNFGAIAHVEKRTSFLARADNLSRRKQQLIAVNIDQVFITLSVVAPAFKPLLVDRYLLSSRQGNMTPIVIINKIDLLTDPPLNISPEEIRAEQIALEEFLKAYRPLNIPIYLLSVSTGENLKAVKALMEHKTSVFSGQSGVGKTSILNALFGSDLPTGPIIQKTRKGSHTTTTAELIPLENEAFCVDTPGIKSFGLGENNPETILEVFPDFLPYASECKFPNCTHVHEPGCAVKEALENEKIHPLRYASYTALLEEAPPKDWE